MGNKLRNIITAIAWAWTAFELNTIGIDVFDKFLKVFPGQIWIMAAVLCYLTIRWMPKNLMTRAICAILMLYPATLFRFTRAHLPASGFSAIHILVVIGYVSAVIGMYGMFYPWRVEAAIHKLCNLFSKSS